MEGMIIKRGMMFYVDFGITRGSEQGGIRPVLVVGNDAGNKYSPVITVVPISSKVSKKRLPTQTLLVNEIGLTMESMAMAEQITTISKEKLISYIGRARKETMREIDETINIALALSDSREKIILEQVQEVKRWENNINDLKSIIGKNALDQIKMRYKIELNKLMGICEVNRKNVNNYYMANLSSFDTSDLRVATV